MPYHSKAMKVAPAGRGNVIGPPHSSHATTWGNGQPPTQAAWGVQNTVQVPKTPATGANSVGLGGRDHSHARWWPVSGAGRGKLNGGAKAWPKLSFGACTKCGRSTGAKNRHTRANFGRPKQWGASSCPWVGWAGWPPGPAGPRRRAPAGTKIWGLHGDNN